MLSHIDLFLQGGAFRAGMRRWGAGPDVVRPGLALAGPPAGQAKGSDSAKKFGIGTTKVTLPKAVAERSASEQRKRKNESLGCSGCAGGDFVRKHQRKTLRGCILRYDTFH